MLVLARLDDRLIHGQVVVGWVKHVRADCIIVANDAIAGDLMQCSLLPMAVPSEIRVEICPLADLPHDLDAGTWAGRRVLLLFASTEDVLRYLVLGGNLRALNVGGLRFSPGKIQVLNAISLGPRDVEVFRELGRRGLRMEVQMVPSDAPLDILSVLPDVKSE
jgi:PTS system mannose-specific IIB component